MARSKGSYLIKVHYPENENDMIAIRRRMGEAYIQFVKDYILTLPISDEGKNRLYDEVSEYLLNRKTKNIPV